MPTDYPRPSIKTTNGNMLTFHYNRQIKQQLKSYVEQHQVTDFMFFASAIMVLCTNIHVRTISLLVV